MDIPIDFFFIFCTPLKSQIFPNVGKGKHLYETYLIIKFAISSCLNIPRFLEKVKIVATLLQNLRLFMINLNQGHLNALWKDSFTGS
jgi:hypothetical protein